MMYVGFLFAHWLGDFVYQTDWQARNKSRNWKALFSHVVTYTTCMYLAFIFLTLFSFIQNPVDPIGVWVTGVQFALITFSTHFVTDAITSRINTFYWEKENFHNFFVSVGFDQFIHAFTIWSTLYLLGFHV